MKVSLYHVKKSAGYRDITGGRLATLWATRGELEAVFGPPQWELSNEDVSDGKVTYIFQFDTPRGPVHVRDYWWNQENEQSIAAENTKAALWLRSFMRNHGYKTGGVLV
jgi:hypothetical protein